jgi:hypothetical protein
MFHNLLKVIIAVFVEALLKLIFGIERLDFTSLGIWFVWSYIAVFSISWLLKKNREYLRRIKERLVLRLVNKFHKNIYLPSDREDDTYKNLIIKNITESNKVYLRLLSGYTMLWDQRESYIFKALQRLSREQLRGKDIRIQLLSREAPEFESRGRWYVEKMLRESALYRCDSFEHYKERCAEIETTLRTEFPEIKLEFYNRTPLWRLHIFDDVMYASNYYVPDGEREEGHVTTAVLLSKEEMGTYNPVYVGLLREFESLSRGRIMPINTN